MEFYQPNTCKGLIQPMIYRFYMGHDARRPVFGVSDKVRFKQPAQAGSQTTEDRFSYVTAQIK